MWNQQKCIVKYIKFTVKIQWVMEWRENGLENLTQKYVKLHVKAGSGWPSDLTQHKAGMMILTQLVKEKIVKTDSLWFHYFHLFLHWKLFLAGHCYDDVKKLCDISYLHGQYHSCHLKIGFTLQHSS